MNKSIVKSLESTDANIVIKWQLGSKKVAGFFSYLVFNIVEIDVQPAASPARLLL